MRLVIDEHGHDTIGHRDSDHAIDGDSRVGQHGCHNGVRACGILRRPAARHPADHRSLERRPGAVIYQRLHVDQPDILGPEVSPRSQTRCVHTLLVEHGVEIGE